MPTPQADAIVVFDNGEMRLTVDHEGRAAITIQSEGEGGREIATVKRLTSKDLNAISRQTGFLAKTAKDREPRPEACAVARGSVTWNCGAAECRCADELRGI